jgi:hypothetical protein
MAGFDDAVRVERHHCLERPAMNPTLRHPLTDLPRNAMLHVADGQSHVIAVFEGQVWLTRDGDPRDVFLEAGDSFSFDGPGLTLVQAFRDARLLVSEPEALDPARRIDAITLHRRVRALRDAAVAALVARSLARAESALQRALQHAGAWLSSARRPLRTA